MFAEQTAAPGMTFFFSPSGVLHLLLVFAGRGPYNGTKGSPTTPVQGPPSQHGKKGSSRALSESGSWSLLWEKSQTIQNSKTERQRKASFESALVGDSPRKPN